jgi:hypothetical protein
MLIIKLEVYFHCHQGPSDQLSLVSGKHQVPGGVGIKSYEFLKKLYGYLNNQKNQGTFVIKFFNAAGNRYFTMPASYASRTNDYNDYLEAER